MLAGALRHQCWSRALSCQVWSPIWQRPAQLLKWENGCRARLRAQAKRRSPVEAAPALVLRGIAVKGRLAALWELQLAEEKLLLLTKGLLQKGMQKDLCQCTHCPAGPQ